VDGDAHDRKRDVEAVYEEQQEGSPGDTDSGAEQRREHVVERFGNGCTGHAHSKQTDIADHVSKAVHHVEHEHRDADEVLFEALQRHSKEHQENGFHDEHRDDELRHIDTEHHLARKEEHHPAADKPTLLRHERGILALDTHADVPDMSDTQVDHGDAEAEQLDMLHLGGTRGLGHEAFGQQRHRLGEGLVGFELRRVSRGTSANPEHRVLQRFRQPAVVGDVQVIRLLYLGVPHTTVWVGLYSGGNRLRLRLPLTSQNQAPLCGSCPLYDRSAIAPLSPTRLVNTSRFWLTGSLSLTRLHQLTTYLKN
jgi:hypothetical protein